jgi:DNA helicase-2/ATP-dependent DNA helicase PcrA
MGVTKDADGDYYRQLIFYKLLLDRLEHSEYRMDTGTIEFTEPENGICRKEVFTITTEEMEALEEQLRTVASEIYNLSFWNKRCDKSDCEFCALREVMPE